MPVLEAEALLYRVRHILRSVANLGSKLLVIGDSISASLAAGAILCRWHALRDPPVGRLAAGDRQPPALPLDR
eukprot:1730171-Pyramimonas_sp.AAC.1